MVTKTITVEFQMCQTILIPVKFFVRIRSTNGNIRDCLLFDCAFIISDVPQSIEKQNFRFFCLFGLFFLCFIFWKTVQILIFKVEYLANGLADFNDFGLTLQDIK